MPDNSPKITVFMPVYNAVSFVQDAIDSILKQSFADFEFLIIDDGSTDGSLELLSAAAERDVRIRLIKHQKNTGLALSRQEGLDEARGEYIAFMDADDIALPQRLQVQYDLLVSRPELGACSAFIRYFGDRELTLRLPVESEDIKVRLLFDSQLANPVSMVNTALIRKHQLRYDASTVNFAEDYDFWVSCSQHFELANCPEVLLRYRVHETNTSKVHASDENRMMIQKRQLDAMGLFVTDDELRLHHHLSQGRALSSHDDLLRMLAWFDKLYAAGGEIYDSDRLKALLSETLHRYCMSHTRQFSWKGFSAYKRSNFSQYDTLNVWEKLLFQFRSLTSL